MTEKTIQKALRRNFISHRYRFTNVYFFENESDFLTFLPNGYCYEIEIKISRSDFKADFKKTRHQIHTQNEKGNKYFLDRMGEKIILDPTWDFCKNFPELVTSEEYQNYRQKRYNEFDVRLRFTPYSMIAFRAVANTQIPNKFFYAVPAGLITKEEVPEYAGLLYINSDGSISKIKDGKFIHKDLLDPVKLFNKTYSAYEALQYHNFKNINNEHPKQTD